MLIFSANKSILFMTNQKNLEDEEEGGRSMSRG